MKGGFSFCGTDIAMLGIEYAPELEETYVYRPGDDNVHEQEFEGHNGGYFYGVSRKPKEFVLRCIFEETVIDKGFMTRLRALFRVGKSGQLVFKRRPWCYYYATVTEFNDREITNYLNGILTIKMKAYYPYARCDSLYNFRTDKYHENVMANSALYDTDGMAPPSSFTDVTQGFPFILGNPGTEPAPVSVIAAGYSGDGVIIKNHTTGQEMKLVAMPDTDMWSNKQVRVDGISGKTTLDTVEVQDNEEIVTESQVNFLYHGYGFLYLDPGYPATRNIYINYSPGHIIRSNRVLSENFIGQYLYADGGWHKITDQTRDYFVIQDEVTSQDSMRTTIMTMNELEIIPKTSMNLSKLSFQFKPTFA